MNRQVKKQVASRISILLMISLLALAQKGRTQVLQIPPPPFPASCINPVDYGAIPNDGLDDREAFQHAVDIASNSPTIRVVCIPAGVWDLSRRPGPGFVNIPSIAVAGVNNLVITGAGPRTRLRMLGSGNHADWRLIDIRGGSTNISIHDMTLDGTQRQQTEEQTHLLHVNGPASNITAERIGFYLPSIGPNSGGDCVRLLGGLNAEVHGVTLRDLVGYDCDRSFIGFQSGVYGVLVDRVQSDNVGDQAIDFEPTGALDLGDITIMNSRFARGPQNQGGYTVAIGGHGYTAKHVSLINTQIVDGSLHLIDAEDVLVQGVFIQGKPDVSEPTIHIRKRAIGIRIVNTAVLHPASSTIASPVIGIHQQSGAAPTDVTLEDVTLEQDSAAPVVHMESLHSFTVKRSWLSYFGPHGAFAVISGRGVTASLDYIELRDNNLSGGAKGFLTVSQYSPDYPTRQVIVTGTTAPGLTTYGVRFQNGLPIVPPIIQYNNFGSAVPVMF